MLIPQTLILEKVNRIINRFYVYNFKRELYLAEEMYERDKVWLRAEGIVLNNLKNI